MVIYMVGLSISIRYIVQLLTTIFAPFWGAGTLMVLPLPQGSASAAILVSVCISRNIYCKSTCFMKLHIVRLFITRVLLSVVT